jgi:AraC-like DNA-binding protein
MDPLSEVLSLLKLKTFVSGGFEVDAGRGFEFQSHEGIKCYAVVSGSCWVSVEGVPDAVLIRAGDCVLLPHGLPFCLARDLSAPRVNFIPEFAERKPGDALVHDAARGGTFILGGHFLLTGSQSDVLLHSLPPIVHIRSETSRKVMRSSLEYLREELRDPQLGGSLIAQQLVYIMLVQALRLHLQEQAGDGVGWFFALSDPQMRTAIACMHDDPSHPWTLQELASRVGMSRTVFAQRFKSRAGMTSMEYLTQWRMLLAADRLRSSDDPISQISSSIGYETDSAFGRAFKKVWGCSPREHRRRGAVTPRS